MVFELIVGIVGFNQMEIRQVGLGNNGVRTGIAV